VPFDVLDESSPRRIVGLGIELLGCGHPFPKLTFSGTGAVLCMVMLPFEQDQSPGGLLLLGSNAEDVNPRAMVVTKHPQ
jgi:hypothetical protein